MKTILSITSAVAVLAMAALPVKAANLLNNGDFNTGDLTSWWTYTPDALNQSITVLPGTDPLNYDSTPFAYEMNHGAGDTILGQDASITGGSLYDVSLRYRANEWGGAGVGIWYYDSSYVQIAVYEWAAMYTGTGADTGWVSFTTPQWTAPANAAYVSVRLDSWNWSSTYYDNVSLNAAPVPEPTTLALLSGGLIFLMAQRRLSRNRSV
jgi:hypothetical protein